jgi:hypothetical protein
MMSLPMILVSEFAGLNDTSYRIASSRARNYWVRLLPQAQNAQD